MAVKDAPGGRGLPGIDMTVSPSTLVVEALGTRVTIASPPEMRNADDFAAACSGRGVNSVRHPREHLHKLSGYLEEHARGGDERLRWVDKIWGRSGWCWTKAGRYWKKPTIIPVSPALGGVWISAYHHPKAGHNSKVWRTGTATPTIELRVLLRRACLGQVGGMTAVEDAAYATSAAEARTQVEVEVNEMRTAQDYFTAHRVRGVSQIYDGQVQEVVKLLRRGGGN